MNAAYKLVVVSPFGKYQRGDVIYDKDVVSAILDTNNNEMHPLEQNVRRVPLKPEEFAIVFPQEIPVAPVAAQPEENADLHLSSVAEEAQPQVDEDNI